MPIAALHSLTKIYRKPGSMVEVHALRDVDLEFEPAEYVAIMGASGSGKSTLLNILGCLDRPSAGFVRERTFHAAPPTLLGEPEHLRSRCADH